MEKIFKVIIIIAIALFFAPSTFAQTMLPGVAKVCVGATISLSSPTTPGVWSSNDSTIATVDPVYGIVTGIDVGTVVISYITSVGSAVITATVNPLPLPIDGPGSVCAKSTITLIDSGGGKWSTANTTMATIGATTGIVTGKVAGVATITYTLSTGCRTTEAITVNPIPTAIAGATGVCIGSTITLSNTFAGGEWSVVDTGIATIATIDSVTGEVAGISPGTTIVSYTSVPGCSVTKKITVNSLPSAIDGPDEVCMISSITLTDSMTGRWTSGAATIATVGATNGIVTGKSAGTASITFSLSTGCKVKKTITVNPIPSLISGTASICHGLTTNFSCQAGCGAWSCSNTSVASICSGGAMTALAAGAVTISYTLNTGCGTATKKITIYPKPSCIVGTDSVCSGSIILLSDCGGGKWSSSDTSIAMINCANGLVTGKTAGSVNISYTLASGCSVGKTITVNDCSAAKSDPSTADNNNGSAAPGTIVTPAGSLHIYPNPSSGSFNLLLSSAGDENGIMSITNILGQKVVELPLTSNNGIAVTMPQATGSGIYLITVATTGGIYQERVMINK
jgi:uncharacterized protein YjdB